MKSQTNTYVAFLSLVAAIGGILFGYDTAVISGTISGVASQFSLDAMQQGWFVGCALVGSIGGVAVAGVLSDRFGRKLTMLLSAVLFTVSAVGCAVSADFIQLVVYRIVGGVGIGVVSIVSPMYISEVAVARWRGTLVSLYQLAITVGFLAAYLVNFQILKSAETAVYASPWMQKINFLHRNQKRIALVADTAADAQNIRLEDIDGIGDAGCQVLDVVIYYLLCSCVTGTHVIEGCPGGNAFLVLHGALRMCCQCFLCHTHQTGCGRVYLKAALSAAGTLGAVHRNNRMTDFCAAEVGATVDFAVNDNTGTYACSQGDADCILSALCCAGYIFAVSGSVGIIFNKGRLAQGSFQILHHRGVFKAQVVGIFDDSGSAVCNTRCAYANPLDILHGKAGLFYGLLCHLCHICGNFF